MDENLENKEPDLIPPEFGEERKLEPAFSPVGAAFLGLVLVFVLYQFGGALLTLAIFGLNFEKADVNIMRLLTMGGQLIFILLPAFIFAKIVYKDVAAALRLNIPLMKEIGIFILGLIILTPLLQSFIYIQNLLLTKLAENFTLFDSMHKFMDELDKFVESAYGSLLESHSMFEGSFIVFVVAVIPAICEETFFRGFFQKSFEQRLRPFWAIAITSIFFGVYHFNPYGLISLIALGAYFGYAAYKSNSLFVTIILHFINNFLAVAAFLFMEDKDLVSSSATQNENILYSVIIFLILALAFFTFVFYVHRYYKRLKEVANDLP